VISRRSLLLAAIAALAALGILYVVVPALAGLNHTWDLIRHGDAWWFGVGVALEAGSFAGYVVLFRAVLDGEGAGGIGWAASARITLAGVAASRVLAAGGVGGIALTVWALGRTGLSARRIATRMTAFLVLLYSIYMAALLLFGVGLASGLLNGPAPFALTIVPAIFAALVIATALAAGLVPGDLARRLGRLSATQGVVGRVARAFARAAGIVGEGVRGAIALLRTRDPALLGAVAWWACDVAVLWACLRAFGPAPPVGVVVMAYFVGMLGNLLPIPGGIGGVEGGMIGALAAFGVPGGHAVVGVLAYRGISLWLPTIPGVIAYLQLVRRHGAEEDEQDASGRSSRPWPLTR
jgi:uncharacterized membrane protein YbhN (UPF0104 family)